MKYFIEHKNFIKTKNSSKYKKYSSNEQKKSSNEQNNSVLRPHLSS